MGEIVAEVVLPVEGEMRLSIKLQPSWFGKILITAGLRKQETAVVTPAVGFMANIRIFFVTTKINPKVKNRFIIFGATL